MLTTGPRIEASFAQLANRWFALLALSVAALSLQDSYAAQPSDSYVMAMCTSCHGPQGNSGGPATPTIAGLSRNYLVGSMLAYKFPKDLEHADALIEQDQDIEDVVALARPGGVMTAIAHMLSVEEIKIVASYFSSQTPTAPVQEVNGDWVAAGAEIHDRYCEKCHEDGGANTADDVGLLAGQWKLYLTYVFEDLAEGHRQMPKKMARKLDSLRDDHGDEGLRQLIDYYAGHPGVGGGQ